MGNVRDLSRSNLAGGRKPVDWQHESRFLGHSQRQRSGLPSVLGIASCFILLSVILVHCKINLPHLGQAGSAGSGLTCCMKKIHVGELRDLKSC